ncbi:N-acetylmannosamine kinase [uncultured archaeon]|nr:N-acetylmannosamine kinase [uncultured archaeon]
MASPRILAIDVGASKLQYGIWKGGKWAGTGRMEIGKKTDAVQLLAGLEQLIRISRANFVSLAVAGFVVDGKLVRMPNLPNVEPARLMAGLRALKVPIHIENDVKCMALAEWVQRGRRANDDFLLVAPGSGIGGARVREGKLVRGTHNTAGEAGHMKLADERGRIRNWEELAGGFGIEKTFAKKGWDAKKILKSRQAKAAKLAAQSARYFGVGLASLANLFDPGQLLVCGSVGRAYMRTPRLKKIALEAYAQNVIAPLSGTRPHCAASAYPALEGAALMAMKNKDKKIRRFMQ